MTKQFMGALSIRAHATVYAPFAHADSAVIALADIATVASAALTGPSTRHHDQAYPLTGPAP